MSLSIEAPAMGAAFLASLVEVVEALTIVLAVAAIRGWRPAVMGTTAALITLSVIVAVFGPLLSLVPIELLQLLIGVLLLLFGLGWLRKATLRASGVLALHDEDAVYLSQSEELREQAKYRSRTLPWLAGIAAYKAVLLEGLEVIFIVIAVGAGRSMLLPASLGALAACIVVLAIGAIVHRPLSRVPENKLKFAVGVMLSSFGVFWTGEGLGINWPGGDAALAVFVLLFLLVALLCAATVRSLGAWEARP